MAIQILIADDHQVVRFGLCRALEMQAGFEVVGQAVNGLEAVEQAKQLVPDIVIMDIAMPMMNGIDATIQIKKECPKTKIIALSMNSGKQFILDMLQAGANAYLLKTEAIDEIIPAINAALKGDVFLTPKIATVVAKEAVIQGGQSRESEQPELSPRERQILQMVAEGNSSKQIAHILGLTENTVVVHRRNITGKLQLNSVAELTKYAIQKGITTLEL
jgi:DNA-binding NarL/FixJ family response regulator